MSAYQPPQLFFGSHRLKGSEVGNNELTGLLRGSWTMESVTTHERLGSGEQRPSPAVFPPMLVSGIYKVLGDYQAGHLQAGDVAIKLAAHLGTVEATGRTQFAGNEAAAFAKGRQDDVVNGSFLRHRILAATVVAEVGPPLAADEPGFLIEELAVNATAVRHDGTFPLPQRPVPPAIVEYHIAAVVGHHLFRRIAFYATV